MGPEFQRVVRARGFRKQVRTHLGREPSTSGLLPEEHNSNDKEVQVEGTGPEPDRFSQRGPVLTDYEPYGPNEAKPPPPQRASQRGRGQQKHFQCFLQGA